MNSRTIPVKSIEEINKEAQIKERLSSTSYELTTRTKVLNDIHAERNRQNFKWGKQHHEYPKWLAILVEEVGEVAEAMQAGSVAHKQSDSDNLYKELIQVAAVATAIAEQVINDDQRNGD